MIRNSIKIMIIFVLLVFLLISGCIPQKRISEGEKIRFYTPPTLSNDVLDKRIDEIKNMLKENILSDDRRENAISILNAYEKIKSLNKEKSTEKEYKKTVQILFNTLLNIEQQYLYSGITSEDASGKIIIKNYSDLKNQIFDTYYAGDFRGVISGCDDLMSRFGKSGLTPDLGIVLVEALVKSNLESEALIVAKSILGAVETRPDLIRLLSDAIEMELKLGNTESANNLYEKLVDNINERNGILKKTGNLLSESRSEKPTIDESVKEKISEIDPEKSIQIKLLVENVERLISQKDFSGARLELIKQRLRAEEGPVLETIEQLLKSVDKAEEQFDTENSNDKLIIDDARKLAEEEKYEEALAILEPLIIQGKNYEAEKLKNTTIEKLINKDKLLAANYKREANSENNILRKRDLLLKARSIFQNLIDKYPESPLIDRIKRNITVVEKELMHLPSINE